MGIARPWEDKDVKKYSQHQDSELRLIHPELISSLGEVNGKRIIDYGCGEGKMLAELVKHGAQVHGVDISKAMIDRAKKRLGDKARLSVIKSGKIPLQDSTIEGVVSNLVLMMCPSESGIRDIFKECYRVLAPRGRLVFCVPHPAFLDKDFTTYRNVFPEGFNYLAEGRPYQFVLKEQRGKEVTRKSFIDYNYSLSTYVKLVIGSGFSLGGLKEINVPGNKLPPYLIFSGMK